MEVSLKIEIFISFKGENPSCDHISGRKENTGVHTKNKHFRNTVLLLHLRERDRERV